MKSSVLLRKLQMEGKEFATSAELKQYCKSMKLDYSIALRHLIPRGYLIRVFRGVFYVKSPEEVMLKKTKYSHLELVAKGLKLKNIENWYFGLYTALKLNNMTHEHFTVDYVINDKLLRTRPMDIAGYKFRFLKLKPKLLEFGVVDEDLKHSDPEKTILDFIYIWRYNGIPKEKIALDIAEWADNTSREKTRKYAEKYPKTVREIVEEVMK